jgi:hypothetical protein
MTSKFIVAIIIATSLIMANLAAGNDVKLFKVKPAGTVYNFLEAVEVGTKDYAAYIDVDLFFESNRDHLKSCSVTQVKKYMDEIVMLPFRHNPPLTGKFVERNEYQIVEEITDYQTAKVTFVKITGGKEVQKTKFNLVARADRWIIANMSGYFEKYIFQACSPKPKDDIK